MAWVSLLIQPGHAEVDDSNSIVVTASRVPTPVSQVGSAVTVITGEELKRSEYRLVSDALRNVPGLAVNRTGGVGALTQVRIRGSESNHTLVIIDGVEVNNPASSSEFDFANLLVTDIERIEILRGAQSAIWGSDAIGGVINIITKKGRGPLNVKAKLEAGSYNTASGLINANGGNEKFDYSLTGSRLHTDGFSVANERNGNGERDGYNNETLNGKTGYKFSPDFELGINGRYSKSLFEGDNFVGGAGAVDADIVWETFQRYGRLDGRANAFNGRWESLPSISLMSSDTVTRTSGTQSAASEGKKTKYAYQANIYLDKAKDNEQIAVVAAELEDEKFNASYIMAPRTVTNRGYIAEYRTAFAESLFLSAGVRFDSNDIFKNSSTHRFTAAYWLESIQSKVHSSYGTGVKNPTLFSLFGSTASYSGNSNLQPEKSRSFDFGVEHSILQGWALIDLTVFDNQVSDLIQGAGNTSVNLAGVSRAQGLELSGKVNAAAHTQISLNYTFTEAKTSDGDEQVRRPRHLGSLSINKKMFDEKLNANLNVQYNGKQKDFAFDTVFNRTRVEMKEYTLVGLALSYRASEIIEVFAHGENLLNQKYEEVYTYGTAGISGYGGVTFYY